MTKKYILQADDVVDNLTSSDQSVPLSANQGRVLDESKQDIMQVTTMPSATLENVGKIVQYIGSSTVEFTNGFFYQCIADSTSAITVYRWIAKNVQTGGAWGSITGTLSNQTDLQTALDGKATVFYGNTEPAEAVEGDYWASNGIGSIKGSDIRVSDTDTDTIDVALGKKQTANLVTAFQAAPDDTHYPSEKLVKDSLDTKSTVSVSQTGTATDAIQYITVDGVEKKIAAGDIPVYEEDPEPSAVAEGEVFATPDGDDVSVQQMIFEVTYPVGFVFIQHSSTDNPTALWQSLGIQATWTDCTSEFANRFEMASTGNNAGTQIEAGLPLPTIATDGAHTHTYTKLVDLQFIGGGGGSTKQTETTANTGSAGAHTHSITEDAIYKSTNTTVMPLTTTVKYWRRTA